MAERLRNGQPVFCPFPNCTQYFHEQVSLVKHLIHIHNLPDDELTKTYAFAFLIVAKKVDYQKFAHICTICLKSSSDRRIDEPTTTVEENEIHLYEHMGIPSFKCTICSTWFQSQRQADQHATTHQDGTNFIIDTCSYLSNDPKLKTHWNNAVGSLKQSLNLSIATNNQLPSAAVFSLSEEDRKFVRVMKTSECKIYSVCDFKGVTKKVFEMCGNWGHIGKVIQSSSKSNVKQCYNEIKTFIIGLILHPRASNAVATLLFHCDKNSWIHFQNLLSVKENRSKLITSVNAAHLFRKIMTNEDFPDDRFTNLSLAFTIDELKQSPFSSIFFIALVSRPGQAAIKLCSYFRDKVVSFGNDHRMSQSVRMLIKTASNVDNSDQHFNQYKLFLESVSSNISHLLRTKNGLLTVQSLIFHSPQVCANFTKQIISPEWVMGKVGTSSRYELANYSHIIQASIYKADFEVVCLFATKLFKFEGSSSYDRLLKDKIGNNILRSLIGNIGDPYLLKRINEKLSASYSFLARNNPNNRKMLDTAKSVLGLSTKRYQIAKNKLESTENN